MNKVSMLQPVDRREQAIRQMGGVPERWLRVLIEEWRDYDDVYEGMYWTDRCADELAEVFAVESVSDKLRETNE